MVRNIGIVQTRYEDELYNRREPVTFLKSENQMFGNCWPKKFAIDTER